MSTIECEENEEKIKQLFKIVDNLANTISQLYSKIEIEVAKLESRLQKIEMKVFSD